MFFIRALATTGVLQYFQVLELIFSLFVRCSLLQLNFSMQYPLLPLFLMFPIFVVGTFSGNWNTEFTDTRYSVLFQRVTSFKLLKMQNIHVKRFSNTYIK